jgi:hypothetical protein
MTIDELRALRNTLSRDIESLLINFTDTTGLIVDSVLTERICRIGPDSATSAYLVSVEAKL